MPNTAGPHCPNHHVPLTRTSERNIGICPISGYRFQFKADNQEGEAKVRNDLYGNQSIAKDSYKITPLDGKGG